MIRRFAALLVAALAAATIGVAAAVAGTYAGPKTWLPGYDAGSSYATNWITDSMYSKSCGLQSGCDARVAIIDTGGNWHDSYTDNLPATITFDYGSFSRNGYCLNNSSMTYTAACEVLTQ